MTGAMAQVNEPNYLERSIMNDFKDFLKIMAALWIMIMVVGSTFILLIYVSRLLGL
jgi:cell division protein FtsL